MLQTRSEMDEVLRAMNEENDRLAKGAKDGWSDSVRIEIYIVTNLIEITRYF